ncbi:hypothetical protein [Listeria booriae]|uniref:hypothetical protein n=1 Tax=Listeria booriae TaxID=1552123 RepID=UPI0016267764|nr:hypothetical protein [Listeria booriae]MBC2149512.1 hypothetical protein [Listeria booriae]
MASIKKSQLYDVIEIAENKKLAELTRKYNEDKARLIQKLIDKHGLEVSLKAVHKGLVEGQKMALAIVEHVPVAHSSLRAIAYRLNISPDYEKWKSYQFNEANTRENEEINELYYNHMSDRDDVLDAFTKVKALVKQARSAGQAIPLLEEIGFDLSDLEPEEVLTLTTTDVRKDLLGLGGNR